jgi:hypothetical protein
MNLLKDSKKHCSDANENYFQHMAVAQKISIELLKASFMAFLHSIIPALFQTNASKKIIHLNKYLEEKKRAKHES